ncbi:MAG TPA: hypothetical protein PLJ60_19640, partial [Chryseolinea sp.]|nr:hypothetical protein [Chryseolinea sp.]
MRRIALFIFVMFHCFIARAQEGKPTIQLNGFGKTSPDSLGRSRPIDQKIGLSNNLDFSKLKASQKDILEFGRKYDEERKRLAKDKKNTNAESSILSTASDATGNNSWVTTEPPLIVPPSPNAASLINQSRETVDLYTGRVNISLPLYILKSNSIEVPIALSYNTSGVRVDDIAGWVGTSFSLEAGGAISRVMKGLPDEFTGKVFPTNWTPLNTQGAAAFGYLNIKNRDGGINLSNFPNYADDKKKRIVKNSDWMSLDGFDKGDGFGFGEAWDTEPDEFYFNFGKYSGKFVFDQDGNIQCLPSQNFKISKTIQQVNVNGVNVPKIVEFVVYTDDGFKYTFGDAAFASVEQTSLISVRKTIKYSYKFLFTYQGNDNLFGSLVWFRLPLLKFTSNGIPDEVNTISTYNFYTSTWYLREIQAPAGDKVVLSYSVPTKLLSYVQSRDERVKMPNISEIELFDQNGSMGWFFITPPNDDANKSIQEVTFSRNKIEVDNRRLSSILSSNGNRVDFIPQTTSRLDLLDDQALEYIKIFDYNGNSIKSFKLQYEYQTPTTFESNTEYFAGSKTGSNGDPLLIFFREYTDNPENQALIESEQKRMFLSKVFELNSIAESILPPYEFTYNPQILPRRTSYKQDKWGFYNSNKRGTKIPPLSYAAFGDDNVPRSGIPLMIWDVQAAPEASFLGASLSSNETLAQAGILKRIQYPTNGSKEFIYEINKTSFGNVGGLRVKEIRTFPEIGSTNFLTENYAYAGGSEVNGKSFQYSLGTDFFGHADVFGSSNSINSYFLTKGGVVGYRTVKISQPGNGKRILTFKTPAEIQNDGSTVYHVGIGTGSNIFPYPQPTDKDWLRGLMEESKSTLEDETKILDQVKSDFNLTPANFTPVYVVGLTSGVYYIDGFEQYRAGLYKYQSAWYNLLSETTVQFDNQKPGDLNKAFTNSTTYEYEVKSYSGKQYTFLRSKTSSGSDNELLKTEFRYPIDVDNYSSTVLPTNPTAKALLTMARTDGNHMLNYPIESISYRNGNVTQSMIQTYKGFPDGSTNIKPYQSFLLENAKVISNYTKFSVVSGVTDPIVQDVSSKLYSSYDKYDNVGNLQ